MFSFSDLSIPVIQAPMAGGVNTPQLVAAVSNAGGLGSFGFAYTTPEKIDADLKAAGDLINQAPRKRINANFFVFEEPIMPNLEQQQLALHDLQSVIGDWEIQTSLPSSPYIPNLEEMLEPIWEHQPEVLTFHFGIPPKQVIEKAHTLNISVGITATSLEEALKIQSAGADFIVAQGIEAGGHRGIFNPDGTDLQLSTMDLLRALNGRVRIPVIAAGGIMDGQDIHLMISVGASAVQMGTAFLTALESGASSAHRRFVMEHHHLGTHFTRAFSGRSAQGIHNEFMKVMEGKTYLPFPAQNTMTAPMRQWALEKDEGHYQSLWAGRSYAKARALSSHDLMMVLHHEYLAAKATP
jgi:nitronate monooxygenase